MKKVKYWSPSIFICVTVLCTSLLVTSCTAIHQKRQVPKCKALFSLVKGYWHRDAVHGLFPMKLGEENGLDRSIVTCQECLTGLSQKEFERLFGKADTIWGSHLVYFLTQPCKTERGVNANGCYYMEGILDGERKVKGVTVAMDQYIIDRKGER